MAYVETSLYAGMNGQERTIVPMTDYGKIDRQLVRFRLMQRGSNSRYLTPIALIKIHRPLLPYWGDILVLTSICTTISAGSPPTAIIPGVGFLEKVANLIVKAGGYFVRPISSDPGTGDITCT